VRSGSRWIHEIKFDGYRVQIHLANEAVKIFTRRGHAFDLLYLNGRDLPKLPLVQRKSQLKKIVAATDIQFSESFEIDGQAMVEHACKVGLEGVGSKVRNGAYRSARSASRSEPPLTGRREAAGRGSRLPPCRSSLRLLRMKRDLLRLQIADQFPGSINRDLIPNSEQNPAIAFDRLVDFRTFITHRHRPVSGRGKQATCSAIYDGGSALFHGKTATPQFHPAESS